LACTDFSRGKQAVVVAGCFTAEQKRSCFGPGLRLLAAVNVSRAALARRPAAFLNHGRGGERLFGSGTGLAIAR
jgi:hypothetical protein